MLKSIIIKINIENLIFCIPNAFRSFYGVLIILKFLLFVFLGGVVNNFIFTSIIYYSTNSKGRGNPGKKLTLSKRNSFYLTFYQAQALIGLLLGDLYMRRTSATANARLAFIQRLIHETYACFLYNLFAEFIKQGYTYAVLSDWSNKTSLPRISINFSTLCLPCFNSYYIYSKKKKLYSLLLLIFLHMFHWLFGLWMMVLFQLLVVLYSLLMLI